MKRTALRLAALISVFCATTAGVRASSAPRYGGTLRVELSAASVTLDPRAWPVGSLESATDEKLASLVYERLVALDNYGRFRPALATDWSHDATNKRWQFTIRTGVKFSDGSGLTAADVVAALQSLLPESLKISESGNSVVFQSAAPAPDLLEQIASGRSLVFRIAQDGTLVGTGPFVAAAAAGEAAAPGQSSSSHLFFRENAEAWSGRPFLDAIDVSLGVPALRAMFDLQLGKADLIELAPDLVPRATQANLRIWTSDPVTLYALRFDEMQSVVPDPRLREALALSLDRGTMANVLLQKQAEPAAALLPEWLSGYAFLFNAETNLDRAKELRRALPPNVAAGASPLRLRVDPAGEMAKLLGERVAVNARQASILVQVVSRPAAHSGTAASASLDPAAGAHLFAWHYSSLSPRAELDSLFAAYNLEEPREAEATNNLSAMTEQEALYVRERRVLEDWRVVPLVEQAESVGLGAAVRDWMPARWGEWHLENVWLESPIAAVESSSGAAVQSREQVRSAIPGAKP
ncbi:MAG TPA: ABC transporter substrate-binding protein [Candidatus Methylomirabilis sp.]|nr:ABC transporter substrate-binding protein [Candidatus Methylomirabilis sp.]